MIRRLRSCPPAPRRGVAAVEMALVTMTFVVPLLIGVWEVGRLIQVQQIVANSAREGARMAAQGFTVNPSGGPTQIKVTASTPNVTDTVYQYLLAAGLNKLQKSDIEVTFEFKDIPGQSGSGARKTLYVPLSSDPVGTSYPPGSYPPDPCYGEKNQTFVIKVRIKDWAKVRWVNLGLVRPKDVSFTVTWRMLNDDPFTVNETLPSW